MLEAATYHDHLVRESARFAEMLRPVPGDARVPTCPDWTADDLLWHLGKVQFFWATVVGKQLTGDEAERSLPERPERDELLAFFLTASASLSDVLGRAAPSDPAWSWSTEQTAGFTQRRQAHEALIHRVDAELTAGTQTPLDTRLAADGVDETLRIMYGGCPDWGTITPEEPARTVRLRTTDTGDSWLVTLARFTGTDPADGKVHDEPDIHIAPFDSGATAQAEIAGTASDLDLWLWRRPSFAPIDHSGDPSVLSGFTAAVHQGID